MSRAVNSTHVARYSRLFVSCLLGLSLLAATASEPVSAKTSRPSVKVKKTDFPKRFGMKSPKGRMSGSGNLQSQGQVSTLGQISTEVPDGALSSGSNWKGFLSEPWAAVGQVWARDSVLTKGNWMALCSGTLFTRGMVVTAAHCLGGTVSGQFKYFEQVGFAPGSTGSGADRSFPFGFWEAKNWWVTNEYRADAKGLYDWGLIEIKAQQGAYPGDKTGSIQVQVNVSVTDGMMFYLLGYPASGYFSTTKGGRGRFQYGCYITWRAGSFAARSDGYELWAPCPMNGGASGGPWLTQRTDGTWAIIGVNNWCFDQNKDDDTGTYCTPTSSFIRSLIFNQNFLDFWEAVKQQL